MGSLQYLPPFNAEGMMSFYVFTFKLLQNFTLGRLISSLQWLQLLQQPQHCQPVFHHHWQPIFFHCRLVARKLQQCQAASSRWLQAALLLLL
jgi:hypothetical protein